LFFFSGRRRHTRFSRDWSSDVCSSDLTPLEAFEQDEVAREVEARSLSQFEHLETAKLDKKPVLPAYLFGDSSVEQAKLDRAIKEDRKSVVKGKRVEVRGGRQGERNSDE